MNEAWRRRGWTAVVFLAVAVSGASLQARGALMPSFQAAFSVSESGLGLLTPVGTLGFVGPVVAAGALAGRIDVRRALLVGLAGSAVALLSLSVAPSFVWLLAFVCARSAAIGVVRALDRPVLGHLYPDSRGRIFTLQDLAWAAGATLGPAVVTLAVLAGDWRLTYRVLAVATLPALALAWYLDPPSVIANERAFEWSNLRRLLARPAVRGMATAMILVGAIESTYFTWLPYYATGFLPRAEANLALSLLLGAYVPGRLVFSALAGRVAAPTLALVASVALVAPVAGTLALTGELGFLAAVFLTGCALSGLFPTLLSWGVDAVPAFTGPVNAVALVTSQVGFLIAPALVGVVAEFTSIGVAMRLQLVFVAALAALLVSRRLLGRA